MSRDYSAVRLGKALRLGLALRLLAATAALASVPVEPLNRLSGAAGLKMRVTAEIKDAAIDAAAEKLAKALGGRIVLHDHLTGYSENWVLDRTRRATLSWKDAPVGRVIRDFCRAYHCMLSRGSENTYGLWPYLPPRAGLHSAGGYRFEVERAYYQSPSSSLHLWISVSADSGDGAALAPLVEKIRVVDEGGRQVDWSVAGLDRSDYPDTRTSIIHMGWQQPAPQRLKSVEGVVRVYRTVRRVEVELPFPRGEEETKGQGGGVSVTLAAVKFRPSSAPQGPGAGFDPGGFRGTMKLAADEGLSVEFDGKPAFCEAVFDDGSRSLIDARMLRSLRTAAPTSNAAEQYGGEIWSNTGATRRSVKLVVPLIVRSEMGESIPFRITDVAMEYRKPGQ